MRAAHLHLLRCPDCRGDLTLAVEQDGVGDRVAQGELACEQCSASFPVVNGIPRFVPASSYADGFGFQWHVHARTQHDSHSGLRITEDRFFAETRWPRALADEVVLEVGSGSGRFTAQALSTGATVVSMDLSNAVEVNGEIHKDADNLLLVQADVARPPLPLSSFDRVFCLGVLQHTPDPESTLGTLTRFVRPGGQLAVDIYDRREGLLGFIEPLYRTYYWVRPATRRMESQRLYRWVDRYVRLLWPLTRWIVRVPKVGRMINKILLVHDYRDRYDLSEEQLKEWAILDTFDNLAPRYDRRATLTELRSWFSRAGFEAIDVHFGHNGIEGRGVCPSVARAAPTSEPALT